MNGYYHFSQIQSLKVGQSLDGERTPILEVGLIPNAAQANSFEYNGEEKDRCLYVFGDKQRFAYLYGDDENDREAYRDKVQTFREYKEKVT